MSFGILLLQKGRRLSKLEVSIGSLILILHLQNFLLNSLGMSFELSIIQSLILREEISALFFAYLPIFP